MTDKEFGRPTKFYWKETDFEKDKDWFEVWIGDQDTSIKCLRTTYSQIKRFVDFIETKKRGEEK